MAPWSSLWDHNRFAASRPALRQTIQSPYARGAVTGVGVITAMAGLLELGAVIASRPPRRTQP